MIIRALDGHLWECHSPSRFRLVGRDAWLMRDDRGWHLTDLRGRRVDVESRGEGTEYVALAFEIYGVPAA